MTTTDAEAIAPFSQYRRSQIAELRPWRPHDDMSSISVSAEDTKAGSPKPGDMIARNPKNHADQWLVAARYFADNFEPLDASRREAQEPADAQINSACMSFRHDFGLLDDAERDRVRFEAKEWLRAWQKEGFGCDRNEVIERCASIVDQCNREGPYQAIAAAPRIRALKDTAPPAPAGEVERLRGALDNCIDTLALVEQPSFIDKVYATDVAILGDRIGYGALMSCASALWRLRLSERGSPVGGEFVSGPCHATVLSTLKQARAALNGGRE